MSLSWILLLSACGWFSEPSSPTVVPAGPPPAAADATWPDVVVVTLDTTRTDHLSLYGYPRDTSPTLDALAAESVVFDRLVVPMATTLPSHLSLFTAVWPTEHGVLANLMHGGDRFTPSEALTPVAVWLKDAGFQTGAFVSAAPLAKNAGLAPGFDVYDDPKRVERPADVTTKRALAWLAEAAPEQPMLLWVHYYDPHNPFRPPAPYDTRYDPEADDVDAFLAARDVTPVATRPTGQVVHARVDGALYDGEIRFMDDQLARVIDAVKARGRWDQTLLVVVGDHGEGLNQHGQPGHGLVWEEQLRAPLLIKAPGVDAGRTDVLLSIADVMPTALSMVDLPDEGRFLAEASGVDVLADGFEARPVLAQTSSRQLMFGRPMTYALTGPHAKCQWSEDAPEGVLWDLAADPFELAPSDDAAARAACVEALAGALATQMERAARLGPGEARPMSDDERRALEALGYLDDDVVPEASE